MTRTGLVVTLLSLLAAPAAAQVQGEVNANAGGGGGGGVASEGFLLGARLIVDSPSTRTNLPGLVGATDLDLGDALPRFYAGYRFGKLGFTIGLVLASVGVDPDGPDNESNLFLFGLAPQVLYEIVGSRSVALDLFAGPVFAFGSGKANGDTDLSVSAFGIDAGVRLIGYLLDGLGLHADVGLHLAFSNTEFDPDGGGSAYDVDGSTIGLYGAVGVMGTL